MCKTARKSPQSNQSNQKCIKKSLLNCVQVICSPDKFYACRSAARTCTFCPLKPIQTQLLSDLGVCVKYSSIEHQLMQSAHYCLMGQHCTVSDLTATISQQPYCSSIIQGGSWTVQQGFTMIPPQLLGSTVCQVIILPTCKHVNWSARRVMQ